MQHMLPLPCRVHCDLSPSLFLPHWPRVIHAARKCLCLRLSALYERVINIAYVFACIGHWPYLPLTPWQRPRRPLRPLRPSKCCFHHRPDTLPSILLNLKRCASSCNESVKMYGIYRLAYIHIIPRYISGMCVLFVWHTYILYMYLFLFTFKLGPVPRRTTTPKPIDVGTFYAIRGIQGTTGVCRGPEGHASRHRDRAVNAETSKSVQ